MPLVQNQIPNLINGVSQQAPSLRLATQAEAQVNGYSTVADGLKKRPPRILKAILADPYDTNDFIHTINRSETERYQMFIKDGDLKVYDLTDGTAKTVNFPDGKGYLASVGRDKDVFNAKTVADYTFITNTEVEVEMDASNVEPTRSNEAIVYVRAGHYGRRYKIIIDGVTVANFQTGDGYDTDAYRELESIDTTNMAKALMAGLDNADPDSWTTPGTGNWSSSAFLRDGTLSSSQYTFTRYANVIHIERTDGGDFEIQTEDGYGETAMYGIKGSVNSFERLPDNAPDGMVIKINGGDSNDQDHYFVKYDANERVWQECPEPGVQRGFDASTMPHVLISNADGTFTFEEATWDDRVAGDEEIIPQPSFVGETVKDITFHRDRLFFFTGENINASRTGDTFNFWRLSAAALLDDDPIDIAVTSDRVAILNYGIPWLGSLFAFSDNSQFNMTADPLLTPKTLSVADASQFANSDECPPVAVGTFLYFIVEQGDYSGVQEYFLSDNVNGLYDAQPTTNHVPAYVGANVFRLIASSTVDMLMVLSEDEPNVIAVYKYYWQGNDKLQSSWSKWQIEEGSEILWADIIDNTLYLTVKYSDDSVAFEQVPLAVSYVDGDLGRPVLLDRRVTEADLSPSYDAGTDKTTLTLPYATTGDEKIQCFKSDGTWLEVSDLSGATFTVEGDHTASELYAGTPYEFRYKLSELFYRVGNSSGGSTVKAGGRLQLQNIVFVYADSTYFRVEVTPRGRQTYTYRFEGRRSGEAGNTIGEIPSASGAFKVPLMTTSEGLEIEVINDTAFPSNFLSAEWKALFVPRRTN